MRKPLLGVLAVMLVVVVAFADTANAATKAPSLKAKRRFLNTLAADTTLTDNYDYSRIRDRDLIAAGVTFCRTLDPIPKPLDHIDFEDVAEQTIAPNFVGQVPRFGGTPSTNGHVILAYSIGIAAVRRFCPQHRAALG